MVQPIQHPAARVINGKVDALDESHCQEGTGHSGVQRPSALERRRRRRRRRGKGSGSDGTTDATAGRSRCNRWHSSHRSSSPSSASRPSTTPAGLHPHLDGVEWMAHQRPGHPGRISRRDGSPHRPGGARLQSQLSGTTAQGGLVRLLCYGRRRRKFAGRPGALLH